MQRRRAILRSLIGLVAAAGLVCAPLVPVRPASAADSPDKKGKRVQAKSIRVDVELVLVPVTVADYDNRLVTGLEAEHFRVYEDKVEQEVRYFSSEDVPISIGLVLDLSGSMSNKADKVRLAALRFLRTANPQDEFFVVSFNDRARLVQGFTRSVSRIQNRLLYTGKPKGRTALLDAIYLAVSHLDHYARHPRRALLIISDGGDNHSRYNERDIKRLVRESYAQIYAVGIFEPLGYRSRTPEELYGPSLLGDIAGETGGRSFTVESLNDLPDIAQKISLELRNQYLIGYKPSNDDRNGKWRKIKVKLRVPKGFPSLQVFARRGYYAPEG